MHIPAIELRELCHRLSKQLGVRLRAEKQLASLRICISVRQKPAHEVLQKLAEVLRAEWQKSNDELGTLYVLVRDNATREQERLIAELMKLKPEDILSEAIHRFPHSFWEMSYQEVSALSKKSEEQAWNNLESLRGTLFYPFYATMIQMPGEPPFVTLSREGIVRTAHAELLNALRTPEGWLAIHLLARLAPQQKRYLMAGVPHKIEASQIPKNLRTEFERSWLESQRQSRDDQQHADQNLPPEWANPPKPIDCGLDFVKFDFFEDTGTLQFTVELKVQREQAPSAETNEEATEIISEAISHSNGLRIGATSLIDFILRDPDCNLNLDLMNTNLARQMPPVADWQARKQRDWAHYPIYLLIETATGTEKSLIGEWHPLWVHEAYLENLNNWTALYQHLMFTGNHCVVIQEDWILLRPRNAVLARMFDVPEPVLKRWLSAPVDLNLFAELATLQRRQLEGLTALKYYAEQAQGPRSGIPSSYFQLTPQGAFFQLVESLRVGNHLEWARFYASLSPMHRKRLQQGERITMQELTLPQQQALLKVLATLDRAEDSAQKEIHEALVRMRERRPLTVDEPDETPPALPSTWSQLRFELAIKEDETPSTRYIGERQITTRYRWVVMRIKEGERLIARVLINMGNLSDKP